MAAARFELNEKGLDALLSSAAAEAFLTRAATGIARDWERLDPRSQPGGHEPPKIEVGAPARDRGVAVVPVYTNDPIWHIIEFGSANNQPYRPATKAAQNSGAKFEDRRR